MMNIRRLVIIVCPIIAIAFFGWMVVVTISDQCIELAPIECRILWGTATASVLGGGLLLEIWIAHRKSQGNWQVQPADLNSNNRPISSSQIWFRSRVIIAVLLAGSPLIARGLFVVTVSGITVGAMFSFLIRGITNQLPQIQKEDEM